MNQSSQKPRPSARQSTIDAPAEVSSQTLFGGRRVLNIEHEGQRYTLRITSNRKLILTK